MQKVGFMQENNIEEILKSLDGLKRASAPPFLFNKIQIRLKPGNHNSFEKIIFFLSRPLAITLIISLIMLSDVIVYQITSKRSADDSENINYGLSFEDNTYEAPVFDL